MLPLPWRYIHNWECIQCGKCCYEYEVVLRFDEWLKLVNAYGAWVAKPSLTKIYLGKREDGSCIFLGRVGNRYYCTLQNSKPKACKIWPFRILRKPKYGRAKEAAYSFKDKIFYIYLVPTCSGIIWGTPSNNFVRAVIPEFIDIALGIKEKQFYSTSRTFYMSNKPKLSLHFL